MARAKRTPADPTANVTAYSHGDAKRKNNPPAGLASEGKVPTVAKQEYHYSPRRPPELRFDATGAADYPHPLLEQAAKRKLTAEEVAELATALRAEPWLEWASKREQTRLVVDPVAIQIHEEIEAKQIIDFAFRQDVEDNLFYRPQVNYTQAVEFYKHDVDWRNRLILGDSLQVMSSLAKREELAGKVQMIYIDPPYGIKFASNFQPEVGKRDVKDKEQDLTREPEMVKAFRDTWHLGVHSYLSYLRDRLIAARELLADTGSVFVQISDENVHRVRQIVEEIFGPENFISQVTFKKTTTATADYIPATNDFMLWYARNRSCVKYNPVFTDRSAGGSGAEAYGSIELRSG